MGERLIDNLARALAEPMPRRRAVRLLGVTLVAAVAPGMRAGRAFAQGTPKCVDRTCGANKFSCKMVVGGGVVHKMCCGPPVNRYFCDGNPNVPDTVKCGDKCPTGEPCLSKTLDAGGCPNFNCCNPKTERCARGGCETCTQAEKCGPKCCPKGSDCCYRPPGASPSRPSKLRRVCCKPPNLCQAGICNCPSGDEACDGKRCCTRKERCATCSGCDEKGCDRFLAYKCCPDAKPRCCGGTCCPDESRCCGTKCCPKDQLCAKSQETGKLVCCAEKNVVLSEGASAKVCCDGLFPEPDADGRCCNGLAGEDEDCRPRKPIPTAVTQANERSRL